MRTPTVLVLLSALIPLPAPAAETGAEYQSWCSRRADSERIAAADRAEYIGDCVDELVQADRNPKPSQAKRRARDDEG